MLYRFFHFNKTAGTTLQNALRNAVHENQYANVDELPVPDQVGLEDVFFKRLLRVGQNTYWPEVDPYTFAVFRDPVKRSFSDFCMLSRWLEASAQDPLSAGFSSAHITLESYFAPDQDYVLKRPGNGYAAALLGHRYHAWAHFRQAFHGANLSPDGVIVEEALKALTAIDLPFLFERLEETTVLSHVLSKGRFAYNPASIAMNTSNSPSLFDKLSEKDRDILIVNNQIDQIIYDRIVQIKAGIDYESVGRRLIEEDDSVIIDFEGAIPLVGCTPRECNPPKYAVWSRPGGLRLTFQSLNLRAKRLAVLITNYRQLAFLEQISVYVGDVKVAHDIVPCRNGFLLRAWLPPELFVAKSQQCILIDAPTQAVGRLDDDREIGIEVSSLSIVSNAH